ncbi:hypothetical protein [Synechococcus sp. CCY 9618]|uniref:hypothetical protein n=1 Tax=Synechococcus sp. CCY 9618 TaxID=2815602 RepID=UPI001C233910
MQFNGTLADLQALVQGLGCSGHWVHEGAFEMLVIEDGESNLRLNWWPGSGALMLVGDPAQRMDLEQRLRDALAARS